MCPFESVLLSLMLYSVGGRGIGTPSTERSEDRGIRNGALSFGHESERRNPGSRPCRNSSDSYRNASLLSFYHQVVHECRAGNQHELCILNVESRLVHQRMSNPLSIACIAV